MRYTPRRLTVDLTEKLGLPTTIRAVAREAVRSADVVELYSEGLSTIVVVIDRRRAAQMTTLHLPVRWGDWDEASQTLLLEDVKDGAGNRLCVTLDGKPVPPPQGLRCVCGHTLPEHDSTSLVSAGCTVAGCDCTWFEDAPASAQH